MQSPVRQKRSWTRRPLTSDWLQPVRGGQAAEAHSAEQQQQTLGCISTPWFCFGSVFHSLPLLLLLLLLLLTDPYILPPCTATYCTHGDSMSQCLLLIIITISQVPITQSTLLGSPFFHLCICCICGLLCPAREKGPTSISSTLPLMRGPFTPVLLRLHRRAIPLAFVPFVAPSGLVSVYFLITRSRQVSSGAGSRLSSCLIP